MAERLLNADQNEDPEVLMARLEQLEVERARYCVLITHMTVMATEDDRATKCDECSLPHPHALWTRDQAELLEIADLRTICDIAERQEELRAVVPFSETPEPAMPQPASTSESIPEQIS